MMWGHPRCRERVWMEQTLLDVGHDIAMESHHQRVGLVRVVVGVSHRVSRSDCLNGVPMVQCSSDKKKQYLSFWEVPIHWLVGLDGCFHFLSRHFGDYTISWNRVPTLARVSPPLQPCACSRRLTHIPPTMLVADATLLSVPAHDGCAFALKQQGGATMVTLRFPRLSPASRRSSRSRRSARRSGRRRGRGST
jgi:hypothetical protein